MADGVLIMGWSTPIAGREDVALDVFNEFVQHGAQCAQDGQIDGMEPFLCDNNGSDLGGFFLYRGDPMKLAALKDSDAFRRLVIRAGCVVEGVRLMDGVAGEKLAREMTMWAENTADIKGRQQQMETSPATAHA